MKSFTTAKAFLIWCILAIIIGGVALIVGKHQENREKVVQARVEYNEIQAMLDENDRRLARIKQRLEALEREFNVDPAARVGAEDAGNGTKTIEIIRESKAQ
jgi:hypothetical protein